MRVKHKDIEFRISRRTLWVGMQAYPLQNVTRVQAVEHSPNRGRMVRGYLRQAGAWVGLGVAGLVVLGCLGDAVPPAVSVTYAAAVCLVLAVHTVRLIRGLTLPNLHILSVATAGSANAALVSTDQKLIHDLTHRIVDAIDNPAMEYAIKVDHMDIVYGDKYGGDRVQGDKVINDNLI